jgi:hypothetical protein
MKKPPRRGAARGFFGSLLGGTVTGREYPSHTGVSISMGSVKPPQHFRKMASNYRPNASAMTRAANGLGGYRTK